MQAPNSATFRAVCSNLHDRAERDTVARFPEVAGQCLVSPRPLPHVARDLGNRIGERIAHEREYYPLFLAVLIAGKQLHALRLFKRTVRAYRHAPQPGGQPDADLRYSSAHGAAGAAHVVRSPHRWRDET